MVKNNIDEKRSRMYSIEVDTNLCACMSGHTVSRDFPSRNSYRSTQANTFFGKNAFVCKFSSSESTLLHSTYLEKREY